MTLRTFIHHHPSIPLTLLILLIGGVIVGLFPEMH